MRLRPLPGRSWPGQARRRFLGSVDTTGPIVVGLQSPILGGIVFDGGGSPLTLTTTGGAAAVLPDVLMNGAMTLRSDLSVNASAGVVLAGTLDSQPGQPQSLTDHRRAAGGEIPG